MPHSCASCERARSGTRADERSEFTVILDAEPHGLLEKAADTVGLAERQLRPDLERFKELIENRGEESGAWRGTVEAETS